MKAFLIILVLAMIAPLLALGRANDRVDRQQQNREAVRRLHEKMNRGDWKAAVEDFAEDTRNHGETVGRRGIRLVLEDIYKTFPDWRMEIVEMIAEKDSVVARAVVSGTHRGVGQLPVNGGMLMGVAPTGKRFEVQHIHWFKLRDGKIVEHYANRDDLGMMQQLGLLPPVTPPKLK